MISTSQAAAIAAIVLSCATQVKGVCNHDNLFRCMNKTSIAGPYCISYNHIPVVTLTITTSIPPTQTPTPTTLLSAAGNAFQTPTCIPSGNSPYLQSAISSVCACISIPTSTSTIYTTPSSTPTSASSFCTPSSSISYHNSTYALYYSGSSFLENDNNPGNGAPDVFPPDSTTFAGAEEDCQAAVQQCADFTFNQEDIYLSFALYYSESQGGWSCTAYWNSNTNATYFDVPDGDVSVGYGYSVEKV